MTRCPNEATEAKEAAVGGLHDSNKVSCWESRVNSRTNVEDSTAHLTACDNLQLKDVISGSPCLGKQFGSLDKLSNSCPLLFASLMSSTLSCSEADHLTCWHRKSAVHPPTLLCQRLFPVHKFYSNAPVTLTKLDAIKHHNSLTVLQQGSGAWRVLEMGSV